MRLQTIVALTDFSTAAEHALDRAALLAAEHKARIVKPAKVISPARVISRPSDRAEAED